MKSFFKICKSTRLFALVVVIAVFCCTTLFAQQKEVFEGYDGFPWGTTLEEIQQKRPGGEVKKTRNGSIMYVTADMQLRFMRSYIFYDTNKLLMGATTYWDCELSTQKTILEKARRDYGEDFITESYYQYLWKISETLEILVELDDNTSIVFGNPKALAEDNAKNSERAINAIQF